MENTDTSTTPTTTKRVLARPTQSKKARKPISEELRRKRIRRPNAFLEDAFPVAYVKAGMNGTQAYQELKPTVTPTTAAVEASKLLRNPKIQEGIVALLPGDDEESKAIKDAFKAKRKDNIEWKDLHKFMETSLKLKGYLRETGKSSVNVGIIIEK